MVDTYIQDRADAYVEQIRETEFQNDVKKLEENLRVIESISGKPELALRMELEHLKRDPAGFASDRGIQ